MAVPDMNPEDLDDFLSKVDQVSDLIKDIKAGDNKEAALEAADDYLEQTTDRVTSDRSVINRTVPQPPPEPLPEGVSPEQAAFMRSIEADARERNERRVKREADALIPKEKGNVAFKAGDYEKALEFYLEASRIDPASPAIYSNCAQAYIKLGNFEAAEDKADWAIRANERWVKGYLRMGVAQCALGKYEQAIATFKTGRGFSTGKERPVFDRYIDDTKLAQELSMREEKLKNAKAETEEVLKVIELGCSKLEHSNVDPKTLKSDLEGLSSVIATELHQDFFRLRGGMKLFRSVTSFKSLLLIAVESDRSTVTEDGRAIAIGVVCSATQLMVTATRANEASRREFLQGDSANVGVLASMISTSHIQVVTNALKLAAELSQSSRVCETLLAATNPKIVPTIVSAIVTSNLDEEVESVAFDMGIAALVNLSKLPRGGQGVAAEVNGKLGVFLRDQLETRSTASRAITAMMSLVGNAASRSRLADPATLERLIAVVTSPKRDIMTLPNALGLLCNLSLEADARERLQEAKFVSEVITLLQCNSSAVVSRVAQLISRLCVNTKFAEGLLLSGDLKLLIQAKRTKDEFEEEIFDAVVRTMTKCLRFCPDSRAAVADCGGITMLMPALRGTSASLIGNAALCIADLAQDAALCASVADTTIVADLLGLARKEKSGMTENCAIALSRLAAGHPTHLARLRQLDGFEVLHSRAPKSA